MNLWCLASFLSSCAFFKLLLIQTKPVSIENRQTSKMLLLWRHILCASSSPHYRKTLYVVLNSVCWCVPKCTHVYKTHKQENVLPVGCRDRGRTGCRGSRVLRWVASPHWWSNRGHRSAQQWSTEERPPSTPCDALKSRYRTNIKWP